MRGRVQRLLVLGILVGACRRNEPIVPDASPAAASAHASPPSAPAPSASPARCTVASVRTIPVTASDVGMGLVNELLFTSPETTYAPVFRAPAVTASRTAAAVAFVRKSGDPNAAEAPSVLVAGWVDPVTGKLEGKLLEIAKGDLGAPALALEGDTLHVVWAAREARKEYRLAHATWERGAPKAEASRALVTATEPAFAPARTIANGRFLIAWTHGNQGSRGEIHFGASNKGLERAAAEAKRISVPTTNARDPEIALDGNGGLLAWSEVDKDGRRIAYASLACAEE